MLIFIFLIALSNDDVSERRKAQGARRKVHPPSPFGYGGTRGAGDRILILLLKIDIKRARAREKV
ncbi:MAG: hypothetical protein GX654_20950 [Desulfatiglans sp.]|nr:hypothetical protein [Desulfatiglans sp.]